MYLIVDGYNIIGAWPEFKDDQDLSLSRDKLIHLLSDFAGYSGDQLTLVFDGYGGDKKVSTVEQVFGITVVYTRQHETADHYIERAVDQFLDGVPRYAHADVRVATNDALEQSVILSRGAVRMSASELRRELNAARRRRVREQTQQQKLKPSTFEDRLSDQQKQALERIRRGHDE